MKATILAAILLASVARGEAASSPSAPWPQFGRDRTHTGRSDARSLAAGRILWSVPATGAISGGPVIDRLGRIFVGGTDGRLAAVSREGTPLWTAATGGAIYSAPAVVGDASVVVATAAGELVELDSSTGRELRRVALSAPVGESSPTVAADGTIYVGTSAGKLLAIGPSGVLWTGSTGGGIYCSPAVGADGRIYVASADQRLWAFDAAGVSRWNFRLSDYPGHSSPVVSRGGDIYVGARDGRLYAVTASGGLKWVVALTPAILSGTPAIGPDGTVFAGSSDGQVAAVAPSNGDVRWKTDIGGGVSGALAVAADGTVYAATDRGELVALGPGGNRIWSLSTGASMAGSPAIDGAGRVYAGTAAGALVATTSDDSWFVPAAARADGQGGTVWRTDLRILNAGSAPTTVSISFLEHDLDNSAATPHPLDLAAGATLVLEDVVGGLLGRSTGVGGLEITSPEPRLVVTSRTYNQSTSGTYGQGIPGFPLASALTAEAAGEIAGLVETDAYRTNLGFLNASPSTVSVRADFRDDAGALLGTKSWTLAPYSQTQSNQVLKGVSTSPVPGARATITVLGGGAVFAYASVVDNRTGDPVFLPAVVPGS